MVEGDPEERNRESAKFYTGEVGQVKLGIL